MSRIQVIAVDNCVNFYPKNLLRDVFEFRYEMVKRQDWSEGLLFQKTPMTDRKSETDGQDTPGTVYFTKQDANGDMVGVIRVSPSIDEPGNGISMIQQIRATYNALAAQGKDPVVKDLVYADRAVPAANNIWETSRILIDKEKYPTIESREPITNELICSTFFYAHQKGIKSLFCFMAERLWESTYKRIGLEVERIGPNVTINDNLRQYNVYAGSMGINDRIIGKISASTGLDASILDFGMNPSGHGAPYHGPAVSYPSMN